MKVRASQASKAGVHYVAADGARIPNEGEVDFSFQDKDGNDFDTIRIDSWNKDTIVDFFKERLA